MALDRVKILATILRACGPRNLFSLVLLIFFSSVIELLLLASVFPTVAYISDFEISLTQNVDNIIRYFFGENFSKKGISFIYLGSFAGFTLAASILRVTTLYYASRISFQTAENLRQQISASILRSDYSYISSLNSSDVALVLGEKSALIGPITNELLTIANSGLVSIAIFALLSYLSPSIAAGMLFFGVMYVAMTFIVRSKLVRNSVRQNAGLKGLSRVARDAVIGIIDVKLNRVTDDVLATLSGYGRSELAAMRSSWFIARMPRYLMEGLSILVIALLLIIFVILGYNSYEIIPLFAVVALGSQRLLPLMQQAFHAYSFISAHMVQLDELLKYANLAPESLVSDGWDISTEVFENLRLQNVTFTYPNDQKPLIKALNFELNKSEFIALQGQSGSGKSTLLKLASGLLIPSSGYVLVNDKDLNFIKRITWFKKVSYVTQDVQLIDGSIAENIKRLFGNQIDYDRLRYCLAVSCFAGKQSESVDLLDVLIGEGGNKISGGQKQRLGLAFALYKEPEILLMDEATSGISVAMEAQILKNIRKSYPKMTVLSVTHRTENLVLFDKVMTIDGL